MKRLRAGQIVQLILLGLVALTIIVATFRYFTRTGQDPLRIPLIVATVAGILFIMIAPTLIRRADASK